MNDKQVDVRQELGFIAIEHVVFRDTRMTVYHLATYLSLAYHANHQGESSYPSYATIAKEAHCSRRTAIQCIADMVAWGIIEKAGRQDEKGDQTSNSYFLPSMRERYESAQGERVVHTMHQGSASGAPGVVHTVHPNHIPSEPDSLKGDIDTPQSTAPAKKPYTDAFEAWWEVYPRHDEKREAFMKYQATIRKGVTDAELLIAARNYAERNKEMELTWLKMAKTFLGPAEPWREYLTTLQPAPQVLDERFARQLFGRCA